ncbi:MAG: TrkH family potassium uptake protein [Cyanophyceae cyanobacterium]
MTPARTVCLGFLATIASGTLLLWLPFSTTADGWGSPITALFTATSAVCVTGLSVVDISKFYTGWGQFFIMLLCQVGGLGYMTSTTFLLLLFGRRFGLRDKLALQQTLEMPGISGVIQLVKSIIAATLIVELTGVFLLLGVFVPSQGWDRGLWLSIFHSVSAFNNAGFSLFSDGLLGFQGSPLLNLAIGGLIVAGGIGYQVLVELYLWVRSHPERLPGSHRRPDRFCFSLHFKIATTTTVVLLVLGTAAFLATEFSNPATLGDRDFGVKLLAAAFQSVTTRTAGFNTVDIGQLTTASLFISIALMFIGASPGGTGGGIKTVTMRILVGATQSVLQGKETVVLHQRQVPVNVVLKAVAVFFGSLSAVILATTLLASGEPDIPFMELFFEAVSAFATVGLSTGITGRLSLFSQLVLVATMFVGRVGVLLLMGAIVGQPGRSRVRYPEEDLPVG